MRIAICQFNATVGDISDNLKKVIHAIKIGKKEKVNLLIFPELFLCGYPPKDLLTKPDFLNSLKKALEEVAKNSKGIGIILGSVDYQSSVLKEKSYDKSAEIQNRFFLTNTAFFIADRKIIGKQAKTFLPSFDLFDEKRYFIPAEHHPIFTFNGKRIGLSIGEDIWLGENLIRDQKLKGASFLVNISASPFYLEKQALREKLLTKRAKENGITIIYCNLIGGQDDLVFDGGSMVISARGEILKAAKRFEEDFLIVEDFFKKEIEPKERKMPEEEELYLAITLGIKDYVLKNGFKKVVVGISGGIDSSLVASLATFALGRTQVLGVIMPGPFSKKESVADAKALVKNLGIKSEKININRIYRSYLQTLEEKFRNQPFDVTEENIQARIRGNILMALANKFNYLVLSTGNKSELAVGYTTLYGDMAGGLAPISDLTKEEVYKLALYLNQRAKKDLIPKTVFTRPPSAELRPNQEDEKDLLPYKELDEILKLYLEDNLPMKEIIKKGFKEKSVRKVIKLVHLNEYKRKQAPVGIRLKRKAFGFGYRMPITNRFSLG